MKKLLAFVAVIALSLSASSFAGGHGNGHSGGNHGKGSHSRSHHSGGGYHRGHGGNRYVTYDQRYGYGGRAVIRPVYVQPVYVETYSSGYSTYGAPSAFGYEGTLGSSIGSAIGGIVHYNKYVR